MINNKPIIGILCDKESKEGVPRYFVKSNYISAIRDAGGNPYIIPPLSDKKDMLNVFGLIGGLLVPGGDDVDSKYFNEEPHPSVVLTNPEVIEFQMEFCRMALEKDLPIFGVCAGFQIINIASGGNIYQDIPSQYSNPLKHKKNESDADDPIHNVQIEKNTKLHEILELDGVEVNSTHHQALKDVADGFAVTARADDGIIEAFESRNHKYVLGVQWHPEDLYKENKLFLKLFERLIKEAG